MRLLPASYVASVRGAAHAAVRKAMLTPDALYYASDIKPAAYCNENPGGPCIVVCTNQRNATLCASRQPAVQHLNNPENLSKRARPPLISWLTAKLSDQDWKTKQHFVEMGLNCGDGAAIVLLIPTTPVMVCGAARGVPSNEDCKPTGFVAKVICDIRGKTSLKVVLTNPPESMVVRMTR